MWYMCSWSGSTLIIDSVSYCCAQQKQWLIHSLARMMNLVRLYLHPTVTVTVSQRSALVGFDLNCLETFYHRTNQKLVHVQHQGDIFGPKQPDCKNKATREREKWWVGDSCKIKLLSATWWLISLETVKDSLHEVAKYSQAPSVSIMHTRFKKKVVVYIYIHTIRQK